ncbi:MAG: CPBP family intramembrane glutamate endopeptidase, partial [Pseudolysinimonas sp.]
MNGHPVKLLPAAGVSLSAFVLFGLRPTFPELVPLGLGLLVASLLAGILIDRELGLDLSLIGIGIGIVSTTSVEADVSWPSFVRIGLVLGLAVLTPFLLDRLLFRRRAITFPWRSHEKKTRLEIAYV